MNEKSRSQFTWDSETWTNFNSIKVLLRCSKIKKTKHRKQTHRMSINLHDRIRIRRTRSKTRSSSEPELNSNNERSAFSNRETPDRREHAVTRLNNFTPVGWPERAQPVVIGRMIEWKLTIASSGAFSIARKVYFVSVAAVQRRCRTVPLVSLFGNERATTDVPKQMANGELSITEINGLSSPSAF